MKFMQFHLFLKLKQLGFQLKLLILYADNDVNNTWEGDNHILVQQTAKYVLDNYQRYLKGK